MLRALAVLLLVVLTSAFSAQVRADSRTEFLARMLLDSDQFRVRTQAALALGARTSEPEAVRALTQALRDEHPAVRAASASALERLGDGSVLGALKAARKDRDAATRAAVERAISTLERAAAVAESSPPSELGRARFYVAVGVPSSSDVGAGTLRSLRDHVLRQVSSVDGVRVAPEGEAQAAANALLKAQRLAGYYLDSSITKIEIKPEGGVRAQVSIIVGTYPGRAMRVMLTGAATVMGAGSSESAKLQAVEAAFTSALRRLPQALDAGLARAN